MLNIAQYVDNLLFVDLNTRHPMPEIGHYFKSEIYREKVNKECVEVANIIFLGQ